jgi:hypothetical protein
MAYQIFFSTKSGATILAFYFEGLGMFFFEMPSSRAIMLECSGTLKTLEQSIFHLNPSHSFRR